MTVSFRTCDGLHYLCAELDGRVVADRQAVGPWESWEVERLSDGRLAFLSAHGRYLCAEPSGRVVADRVAIGAWETWTPEASNGGVALKSAHGRYLVAEGGGGSVVQANREQAGAWETFVTSESLLKPPKPPVEAPTALEVEGNKRYFRNAHGRVNYREISAFTLLSRLLKGQRDYVRAWLAMCVAERITATRVFLSLDNDYWAEYRVGPHIAGFWQAFDTLVQMHADAGLYMRVCIIGGLEPWGGVWDPVARRDIFTGSVRAGAEQFAVEVAQRLVGVPHVLAEIANEPTQIGMRDSWPAIVELGKKMKRVNPGLILSGGEDNDGRGMVVPFDYCDAHLDRDQQIHGWRWVKRALSEHAVIDQAEDYRGKYLPQNFVPMPFLAGENVNMGEFPADGHRGDNETQGSVCFGVAALSRARRVGGVCFHWDGGLWTTLPKPETVRCLRAWNDGFDAFPMLTDSMWRGHWGLARGDYWRDSFPPDDDPATVDAWVSGGRGPWRACGCGAYSVVFPQPKGWNWVGNLDAPADRVGFNSDGTYDCGVYKRR